MQSQSTYSISHIIRENNPKNDLEPRRDLNKQKQFWATKERLEGVEIILQSYNDKNSIVLTTPTPRPQINGTN